MHSPFAAPKYMSSCMGTALLGKKIASLIPSIITKFEFKRTPQDVLSELTPLKSIKEMNEENFI